MNEWKAGTPFRFVGCVELREVLGRKAADVEQLLTGIEAVPLDSIYYHTHSYFLRYEHGPTLFPSDFATDSTASVIFSTAGCELPASIAGISQPIG